MNFNAFQHSPFLQSLGWAIANSIWQAGICWLLYNIIISSYANASAKLKNNVSTFFLFTSFFWFVATFFNKLIDLQSRNLDLFSSKLISYPTAYLTSKVNGLQDLIPVIGATLPYLSVAYLLLLLIFTVKLVSSYRTTVFIKSNGLQKPGVEWRLFVDKVAGHMNITKKVKLWFSKHVDVPATIGFLKPVILIPLASLNQLTPDQLEAIILHELSHIKRNDYLINIFISLVETILFFNPFTVLLSKVIKKERENCCDDFVLQYQYDRHSYASALLSLEKYRNQSIHLALTATSGRNQLLYRIRRIMGAKNPTNGVNYGQKLIALFLITAMIGSIAWLSPVKKTNPSGFESKSKNKPSYTKPTINREVKTYIDSKLEPTKSPLNTNKVIKNNIIALIDNDENNPPENQDLSQEWKSNADDDIKNQWHLVNPPNDVATAPPAGIRPVTAKNSFFLPNVSESDLKSIYKFYFDLDVSKLKSEIENIRQSLSSFNWNDVGQEVMENLEKVKIASEQIDLERNQAKMSTDKVEKQKARAREVLKNHQFAFAFDNLNDSHVNERADNYDSLFLRNNRWENEESEAAQKEYIRNFSVPVPSLEKRIRTLKVFPKPSTAPNSFEEKKVPPPNFYLFNKENLPSNPPVHIVYKKGSIVINGQKLNFPELKEYQVQVIIKKLLENCAEPILATETED
jgi:beta-lactamase regulating signal transducer with metallopeptidase domain